jgi:hypothetical protein
VIDLAPALRRAALAHGLDALYTATGHHTAEGNRVVAETLAEELRPWIELAQR